jgi:DNA excision repair protein ERCC-4
MKLVKIYADERERPSKVPKYLINMGVSVIFKQLPVGDYIVSEGVLIERKRIDDLVKSVFDGRLFDQVRRLKQAAERAVLIIEGDLEHIRNLTNRWKAIEAALLTISIVNSLPIIYTRDTKHTAEVIKYLAEKMQKLTSLPTPVSYARKHVKPKTEDLRNWQVYVVTSLPGIGPKLAERLLEKFGNVRAIFNATKSELTRVEGLSEEKAERIIKLLTYQFKKEEKRRTGLDSFM